MCLVQLKWKKDEKIGADSSYARSYIRSYFKSKQLVCSMSKKNDALHYQHHCRLKKGQLFSSAMVNYNTLGSRMANLTDLNL